MTEKSKNYGTCGVISQLQISHESLIQLSTTFAVGLLIPFFQNCNVLGHILAKKCTLLPNLSDLKL